MRYGTYLLMGNVPKIQIELFCFSEFRVRFDPDPGGKNLTNPLTIPAQLSSSGTGTGFISTVFHAFHYADLAHFF